ncbi:MAG: ABC transporter permease [Chitinophagaceae bacterium]|nr:ABC transporter permease [Chitinophagaceae bacterium]
MFKTNLKIAWRNLLKDSQFTFLNILGLSAGLACALLILFWVNDEMRFDKFLDNDNRLYQLLENESPSSSGPLSEIVKKQIQGVEYAAAVAPAEWFSPYTLSSGDKSIKATGQYVGEDYFNIFSFKLVDGNKNEVLKDRGSIVISDELAKKLFGTAENVVGKPVLFDEDTTFHVSGVFQKIPLQSSQQFDFVLSFKYFQQKKPWAATWDKGPRNYVLLTKGTDINAFNKIIANVVSANTGDSITVSAVKYSDVYLYGLYDGANYGTSGKGRIQYVRLFSVLAIFILVIACINFMNLSTAKASRRLKEIGIKKVIGAERKHLIMQFLTESLLLTLLATVFAVIIALSLLPAFNSITGKQISLHFDPAIVIYFVPVILCTGLLAGSYPALYLSKFNPLSVLKGKIATSLAEVLSRKGLVVFQFTLSTILIVAVMIIYQQVQFIQSTDIGYRKDNVIRLPVEGNIKGREKTFIAELKNIPGVANATSAYHKIVGRGYGHSGMKWPGKNPNDNVFFEAFEVDYDFVETMGMQMKEGRTFSRSFGGDSSKIILNEKAVEAMRLKNPVGQTIIRFGHPVEIIGVVKDFRYESLHQPIHPAYLFLWPGGTIFARVRSDNQPKTIAAIEKLYERYNPGYPFTFSFLDEAYQKQYDSELRVSALSKYFAGLAIIISCLGLFGLAAFTAQKRRKEIGVRKVVGASVANITAMLSKEFLRLTVISLIIALPVAWWLMSSWLENFAYRINITPSIFLVTAVAVILITVLTVSFQTIKAALANPVKSLRTE